MSRPLSTILMIGTLAAAGCTESFDPTVPGTRPFAVFAPLHAGTDTQFVRLTATSDPTDASPAIVPVPGAVVTVAGPGGTVTYQPVVRPGEPGSPDSIIVEYRADGFRPVRGGAYLLQVSAPAGAAMASIVIPASTGTPITTRDPFILSQPHSYPLETPIVVNVSLSNESMGYMVRLLIEYEVNRAGVWELEREEVPLAYTNIASAEDPGPIFPMLARRTNTPGVGGGLPPPETVFFSNRVYEKTISLIHGRFGSANLRMRRALFVLLQADRHLFTYYAYANSFDDRFTIRLDQPDYSNVQGALGIFGAMASDTLAQTLPANLKPR
jgi:hypothetical protein